MEEDDDDDDIREHNPVVKRDPTVGGKRMRQL
jgi:hypothetical protein